MLQRIKVFVRDSKAVSALEYAILIGVISVAIAAVLVTLSDNLTTAIEGVGTDIEGTVTAGAPDMTN